VFAAQAVAQRGEQRVVGDIGQVCDVQALVGDTVIARGAVTLQRGGAKNNP